MQKNVDSIIQVMLLVLVFLCCVIGICMSGSTAGFEAVCARRQLIGFLGLTLIGLCFCCALVPVASEST